MTERREAFETPLSQWLERTGTTIYALSKVVGCTPRIMAAYSRNQTLPGLVYAFKIERATRGQVPVASWLGTPLGLHIWKTMGCDFTEWKAQKAAWDHKTRTRHGKEQAAAEAAGALEGEGDVDTVTP